MANRPWTKKRKSIERCALIREAKKSKDSPVTSLSCQQDHIEHVNIEHIDSESEFSSSASGLEEDASFTEDEAQEIFDDFMMTLPLDSRKILAVSLMEHYRKRQGFSVKDAALEAASFVGFHLTTIQKYRNDFYKNNGKFTERRQGKYERATVYRDENINSEARKWVRENAFIKGEPNMTAQNFCKHVNDTLLLSSFLPPNFQRQISVRTGIRWLHHLGFKPRNHKKGIYIDGHERKDVVEHCKEFIKKLKDLRDSHKSPPPCSDDVVRIRNEEDEEKKQLILLYHDESIYNCNEGQNWMWGEEDKPAILPKTKGSGIMIAEFISEYDGFLQLSDEEEYEHAKAINPNISKSACVSLEYGAQRDRYFTGDRFLEQMKRACDIVEFKYPPAKNTVVFVLDQSSCHKKFAEHALIAKIILLKDGGPRRVRDTIWAGALQLMINSDGTAKGLKTILMERGINPTTLKADDMRTILSVYDYFRTEKTHDKLNIMSKAKVLFVCSYQNSIVN